MECYECAREGTAAAAVAVCRECGAAVCVRHVRTEETEILKPAGMGKVTSDQSARRLTCPVCRRAETTA